jgi:hypothetical protein
MKRIVVIAMIVTVAGIATSAASAVRAMPTWTVSKAELMLVRDASVQLPASERRALEGQLREAALTYSALALAAEVGDPRASLAYQRVVNEYQRALSSVIDGIDIARADCAGSGREFVAHRFRRFDCFVTSEVLRVPTIELEITGDGGWPPVVEREPRLIGPLLTQLRVRVTGTSSFAYE